MRRSVPESDLAKRTPLYRPGPGRELDEELAHHLALLASELEREGMNREVAETVAARRLGVEGVKNAVRQERRWSLGRAHMAAAVADSVQQLRHSLRRTIRASAHSAVIVSALSVAIGGALVVSELTDALFLRSLPVPDPERVVTVYNAASETAIEFPMAYPTLRDHAEYVEDVADMGGFRTMTLGLHLSDRALQVDGAVVTGGYFSALGLRPALGRLLDRRDDQAGGPSVVVVGYDLWRSVFGSDPEILGSAVEIGRGLFTVVGVAPQGFQGLSLARDEELWIPVSSATHAATRLLSQSRTWETRFFAALLGVARLRPGVTSEHLVRRLSESRRDLLRRLGPELMPEIPEGIPAFSTEPIKVTALGDAKHTLMGFLRLLGALSIFSLGVGALSVLQLQIAHHKVREQELAVRRSLGASRGRIMGDLTLDALLLVLLGALGGILVGKVALVGLGSFDLPGGVSMSRLDLKADPTTYLVATAVAALLLLFSGLTPAWLASREDPARKLKLGRRSASSLLVGGQVALSLLLVLSASLFIRSVLLARAVHLGFETDGRVALTFSPAIHGYQRAAPVAQRLLDEAGRIPGVESAALAAHLPLSPWNSDFPLVPLGRPANGDPPMIPVNTVLGPYFTVMGIPLLDGRVLGPEDGPESEDVAVVNRAAAELLWPGENPLGRYFKVFEFARDSVRVVGLVENALARSTHERPPPIVYREGRQDEILGIADQAHLVARVRDPARNLGTLQQALSGTVANLPPLDPRSLDEQVARVMMPQRLGAILFTAFGVFSVLLAAVGVAGVVAAEVIRRRREMGIRMAVGATPVQAVTPSIRGIAGPVGLGVLAAAVLAPVVEPIFAEFLIHVDPMDPLAILATVTLSGVAGALALAFGLSRGGRIDPAKLLSEEKRG